MYRRSITPILHAALEDRPVVLLNGARQVGKSTLVQELGAGERPARYLTLDDAAVRAAASYDPAGFLAGLSGPVTLDEVQRVPDLFLAIKAEVDRNRRPGRFLLTGSADFLLLPRVSDSLAGRMEIVTLWPLSQGEIEGRPEGFVDALFGAGELPALPSNGIETRDEILARALLGGYPEIVDKEAVARRRAWFTSYAATILQRDVRDLANIEGLTALPRLLSLLAARAGSLLNFSELARSSGLPQSTLKRYFALLEATFLVQTLPAWSSNLSKRLTKSPKVLFGDTGLLSHTLGLDAARLAQEPDLAGLLLENFVLMEVRKQATWSAVQPRLFHYRTLAGEEVDLLLEDAAGRCVGIEVKASATISPRHLKPLESLAEVLGKRFRRGILLYTGREAVPFGERLHALPMSALWRSAPPG